MTNMKRTKLKTRQTRKRNNWTITSMKRNIWKRTILKRKDLKKDNSGTEETEKGLGCTGRGKWLPRHHFLHLFKAWINFWRNGCLQETATQCHPSSKVRFIITCCQSRTTWQKHRLFNVDRHHLKRRISQPRTFLNIKWNLNIIGEIPC